jgi:CheY-like chemotaxis protein
MSKTKNYDFIILDLDMPIMDGFETCAKIRKKHEQEIQDLLLVNVESVENSQKYNKKQPIIIALSAFVNSEVIVKTASVGFDFCGKFVDIHYFNFEYIIR